LGISLFVVPNVARADVSLLVLEAVGMAGEYTGSGHTAIYLSNICADGPVDLRLCQAGERGVVISNYPSFGDKGTAEWMAVPLMPYLYGVEDEKDIPLYANGDIRNFLRETYRQKHLRTFVQDDAAGTMPKGGWKMMLTAAFNRDVYSFNVQTSVEEDAKFLKEFNSVPNKGKFNSLSQNCADFAKRLINGYFPGAARRDVINDFGITTPKAVARSFTGFASSRPERLFHITKYSQVAGSIWRSFDNRNFTEIAFKSKKYVIPSLIFKPSLLAIFAGTYLLTGRFNVHDAYKEFANAQIARLNFDRRLREENGSGPSATDTPRVEVEDKIDVERSGLFGSRQVWDGYKTAFAPILRNAIAQGLFQDPNEVKTFFRDLELQSEPAYDANNALILQVNYYGEKRVLGITRHNILNADSDRELALKLMLAKINAELNASEKNRSSLDDFNESWRLMRQLSTPDPWSSLPGIEKSRGRFLKTPPKTTTKRKFELFVRAITH
jgi:hypothetical protein